MVLTAEHLESALARFHDPLVRHREALNRCNAYPELLTVLVGDRPPRSARIDVEFVDGGRPFSPFRLAGE